MGNKSDKSNTVALLLYFIVGIFGVHRFYVGKIGTGVVQLLSCVFPILVALQFKLSEPGSTALPLAVLALAALATLTIWMLVDGVLIVMQKFTDKNGNTLTFS